MTPDQFQAETVEMYLDHVNPYLAKLMNFAGFGVETRAEGTKMYDQDGKSYLDFLGSYGVFALGHRHPDVVAAVKNQLDCMPLSGKTFFNRKQAELATKLSSLTPELLQYTFFSNSGTEAVEAALKFARASTGRQEVVSTIGGYHGKTYGALAATGREKYQKAFGEMLPGSKYAIYGDLDSASALISDQTAAVIIEIIQGEGGIILPPDGYLSGLEKLAKSAGAKFIVDEVQTGIGRTGPMFGIEREGLNPDILVLAKALGGGVMPIGATMFSAEIGEKVFSENPLAHTSTFGGNPLACAAALATLEVIERDGLCQRSEALGSRLMLGLKDATSRSDLVTEVRGRGLMVGVEFSMDEVGELVIAQMVKRGLVAAYTLNNPRVIRFEPALIISEEEVDLACAIFGEAVAETSQLLAEFA